MFRLSQANPGTNIVTKVVENAKKFGVVLPLEFAKETSDRENIISQLLVTLSDESKIAEYFTDFLIVNKIPWTKTRDLMLKALTAQASGGNVEQVLDFALKHYVRKLNFPQTKDIIESGLKLQAASRNINVFQVLNDALDNKPPTISFVGLAPDSSKDIFTLNRLVALTLNKNEEDTEMLRRELIKSLDTLQRTREVDDRLKSIIQTLDTITFNEQLTNITRFCTRVFEISMEDPVMLAFRRLLLQIKLGIEFRAQFLSDYESNITSPRIKDPSTEPGQNEKLREFGDYLKTIQSSTLPYTFIKVAQPASDQIKNKSIPAADDEFQKFLTNALEKVNALKVGLGSMKSLPENAVPAALKSKVETVIGGAEDLVANVETQINSFLTSYKSGIFSDPAVALTEFLKIWDKFTDNLTKQIQALPVNLPEILKSGQQAINTIAVQFGFDPRIFENAFGLLIGASAALSLASGDLKGVLSAVVALIAADDNLVRVEAAKSLGKPVPKRTDQTINLAQLEQAFRNMGATNDQLNTLLSLDQYAGSVKATVADREATLVKRMTTEIKTNSSSNIDAPLAGNKEIQQEYARFYAYLQEVNKNLSYYLDFIDTLVKQFRTDPKNEKLLLAKTGPALQRRATIEATVVEIRSKLAKYKSYSLIVQNVQKRNRLIMDLQVIVPELEKYMATGISIADLFLQPNGLRDKMKEMSDSLIQDRDRLFKEMQRLKDSPRVPIRFKDVPTNPSVITTPVNNKIEPEKPITPDFLGTNEELSMFPSFSTFDERPRR